MRFSASMLSLALVIADRILVMSNKTSVPFRLMTFICIPLAVIIPTVVIERAITTILWQWAEYITQDMGGASVFCYNREKISGPEIGE
jgi:hypothetical protein